MDQVKGRYEKYQKKEESKVVNIFEMDITNNSLLDEEAEASGLKIHAVKRFNKKQEIKHGSKNNTKTKICKGTKEVEELFDRIINDLLASDDKEFSTVLNQMENYPSELFIKILTAVLERSENESRDNMIIKKLELIE